MLFGKPASLNAVDAINGSDVPVLIIHGIDKDMTNVISFYYIYHYQQHLR